MTAPTREELADALHATASLLYDVWRCNNDEERSALGTKVAAAVERWAVHPSWILSGESPIDPTPTAAGGPPRWNACENKGCGGTMHTTKVTCGRDSGSKKRCNNCGRTVEYGWGPPRVRYEGRSMVKPPLPHPEPDHPDPGYCEGCGPNCMHCISGPQDLLVGGPLRSWDQLGGGWQCAADNAAYLAGLEDPEWRSAYA